MKKAIKTIEDTLVYYKYVLFGYLENYSYHVKRYFINLGAAFIGRVQNNYRALHIEHAQDVLKLSREIRNLETEIASLQSKVAKKTATVAKSPVKKKKTSGK